MMQKLDEKGSEISFLDPFCKPPGGNMEDTQKTEKTLADIQKDIAAVHNQNIPLDELEDVFRHLSEKNDREITPADLETDDENQYAGDLFLLVKLWVQLHNPLVKQSREQIDGFREISDAIVETTLAEGTRNRQRITAAFEVLATRTLSPLQLNPVESDEVLQNASELLEVSKNLTTIAHIYDNRELTKLLWFSLIGFGLMAFMTVSTMIIGQLNKPSYFEQIQQEIKR